MNSFVGFAEETAYGEATATFSRYFEFLSESFQRDPTVIESEGIRDGAAYKRQGRWAFGTQRVAGTLEVELNTRGMGVLLKHMMGAIATTGTGPYTHTATPGELFGKSFRLGIARPDISGTRRFFTYTGLKVGGWTLTANLDEMVRLSLDLFGREERTTDALPTVDYTSVGVPVPFTTGSLTIGGVATPMRSFTLSQENGFNDDSQYTVGSTLRNETREYGLRSMTASADADFTDLTAYNRVVSGAEALMTIVVANTLTITCTVRTNGEAPNVGGIEEIRQPLEFEVLAGADGKSGISLAYATTDATP